MVWTGWIAAATLEPVTADVVVVVVVAAALDCATTRAPSVEALAGGNGGEVGEVTVLGPGPGSLVVVVGAGAGSVVVLSECVAEERGAAARFPEVSGWPEVAATKARREMDTARTAHQCGRIRRVGWASTAPLCELSLATA